MQTSGALRRMLCSPIFPEESWVLEWIPIRVGYVWTGKYDLKTDTCARENFWIRKKKVQIQYIQIHVDGASVYLPWVPEVFLACGGNFRRPRGVTIKTWQKPETALEKSMAPRVQCTEHYKYIHNHHHRHLQKIWSAKIYKLKIYLQSLY